LAAVATKYDELQKLDVEVLAVSVDSQFVHKVWQEEELSRMVDGGVPFPMVSDGAGKIGSIYGVYDEGSGVDVRGRFIIDPDGIIQAIEVLIPPVGRNVTELLRQKRPPHRAGSPEGLPSNQALIWWVRSGRCGKPIWRFSCIERGRCIFEDLLKQG
jgi:peroxiredoxin (alkyl hydroperoxide reductase subunit C)